MLLSGYRSSASQMARQTEVDRQPLISMLVALRGSDTDGKHGHLEFLTYCPISLPTLWNGIIIPSRP